MFNKMNLSKIKKDYLKVPIKLFDLGLTPQAIGLFCYLLSCGENFHPSNRLMCTKLGLTYNTLTKYLKELKDSNIITIHIQGSRTESTKYKVIHYDEWTNKSLDNIEKIG